jgi:hypothetical protein
MAGPKTWFKGKNWIKNDLKLLIFPIIVVVGYKFTKIFMALNYEVCINLLVP